MADPGLYGQEQQEREAITGEQEERNEIESMKGISEM